MAKDKAEKEAKELARIEAEAKAAAEAEAAKAAAEVEAETMYRSCDSLFCVVPDISQFYQENCGLLSQPLQVRMISCCFSATASNHFFFHLGFDSFGKG